MIVLNFVILRYDMPDGLVLNVWWIAWLFGYFPFILNIWFLVFLGLLFWSLYCFSLISFRLLPEWFFALNPFGIFCLTLFLIVIKLLYLLFWSGWLFPIVCSAKRGIEYLLQVQSWYLSPTYLISSQGLKINFTSLFVGLSLFK